MIQWRRVLVTWLLMVLAETVHGILRQRFLAPWIGDLPARQVGVFIGSAIIFVIAWATIRWIDARGPRAQFAIGAAWVGLMAGFECALGMALGYSSERMWADYDLAHGGWMGFGLLFLLCSPLLAAKVCGLR